jgi:hypothetical protein
MLPLHPHLAEPAFHDMARTILPPRGYFIPTHMIYKSQMPPAVFVTWLQLYGLTWSGLDIPPIAIAEWIDLTGISRSSLIRHLNWLQSRHLLKWHSSGQGVISVVLNKISIPPQVPQEGHTENATANRPGCSKSDSSEMDSSEMDSSKMDSSKMDSSNLDSPSSLNPSLSINSKIQSQEPVNLDSKQNPVDNLELQGEGECEGEGLSIFGQSDVPPGMQTPVTLYRSVVHLTPNSKQRRLLETRVTDLPLWQATIEHWIFHGWNPRNLAGMLDLYARGGPSTCRYCQTASPASGSAESSQARSQEALEDLRREMGVSSPLDSQVSHGK